MYIKQKFRSLFRHTRYAVVSLLLTVLRVVIPSGDNLRYFLGKKFLLHATKHPMDFSVDLFVVNHRLACGHTVISKDLSKSFNCPHCDRRSKVLSFWSSRAL